MAFGFQPEFRSSLSVAILWAIGDRNHRTHYYIIYPIKFLMNLAIDSKKRTIDVLVHVRKSSDYLLKQLIPALQPHCRVEVIDGFIDSLADLFNRSRVYLYDSAEYWATQGVTEGFGLQPLEAIACGCQVFSSINHGLSDYLDPGFNCHKIAGFSTTYDVDRILAATKSVSPVHDLETLLAEYRTANILSRLHVIIAEINHFFDRVNLDSSDLPDLNYQRILQLRLLKAIDKYSKKTQAISCYSLSLRRV